MKQVLPGSIFVLAGIIFISGNCSGQKISDKKVPAAVKKSFQIEFPGITSTKWELEDKNYEANFKSNGQWMSAVIDVKGTLLETETEIPVSELPSTVKAYISQHYKSATVKEAALMKKANGDVVYEAEVNHKDILFNNKGEFIKEQKD